MPHVNVSDELYRDLERRAAAYGFANVDEYVADVLLGEFHPVSDNLDRFFTPERLKLIDEAAADVDRGNFYTLKQANELLDRAREEWLRNHSRGDSDFPRPDRGTSQ